MRRRIMVFCLVIALACGLAARAQSDQADRYRVAQLTALSLACGLPDPLGLIYDSPDKQLSPADVQKIAEAYLLWHGNHGWRVSVETQDGDHIAFTLATEQNAPVAKFVINRHSGRLDRIG